MRRTLTLFRFIQEMAGEIPYEIRTVKGLEGRQKSAKALLSEEREDWLLWLERENQ